MPELKDPAIKLFGKTIQLLPQQNPLLFHHNKKPSRKEVAGSKKDESSTQPIVLEGLKCSGTTSSRIGEDPKTPQGAEKENPSPYSNTKTTDHPDPNETDTTASALEENTLQKPDKIVPCPRCNSMDTKFCYYNNYSVNQPRHFCKNCQRYWTAGGSMRNVPIGSGRRKNKNSPYRQLIVPENLQPVNLQNNILAFGSDEPLCESMASVLKLADTNNATSLCQTEIVSGPPTPTPIPCFPAPPWPWTNQMSSPVFGPSTYPVSFYPVPAPYWGYTSTVPNPWNMALLPQHSPTLGKHQREVNNDADDNKSYSEERGVLIPKTLRMNDPNEAAKSSILSTLGINNENAELSGESTLYRAFRCKGSDHKNHVVESSPVLQANPAALSRSLNFHETS